MNPLQQRSVNELAWETQFENLIFMDQQNVKVVLRCRPMSASEKARDKAAVQCVSEKAVEVLFNSLGKSAKKQFCFDGVFDDKTTQKDFYEKAVQNVVEEVLQGYNCTVFAYGQTGTGKTFTMEGQIGESSYSDLYSNAGVVPRAVEHVFKYLEENELEYQVRLSVVELYNEELSDLIAAADDESSGKLRKLRLLEDPKKGIVLQGVEERPVNTANDIFTILEGTNKQRKTAETLCNKQSSRSHSIFTLKIFMKEKTVDEEELIKTGTLNLVDLAGSECVGRSGAIGDRKKEAGQINQSLLTLGRVITALVDHQPHIPYRESKLTRLLQESLGGRTKTLIIATVSPTSSNVEETMSTLDYACRAKNIKNTPEINQIQTKKSMMKDLAVKIADLQEQLKAQREGNGVYLPTSKYETMTADLTRLSQLEAILQAELDEKQQQYDALEILFKSTSTQLRETEADLGKTRSLLDSVEAELGERELQLLDTFHTLQESEVLLQENKAVGTELFSSGSYLLNASKDMNHDLGGLFAKIDRKNQVVKTNEMLVADFLRSLHAQVESWSTSLGTFKEEQGSKLKGLQLLVAEYVVQKDEEINDLTQQVKNMQSELEARVSSSLQKASEHQKNVVEFSRETMEHSSSFAQELEIEAQETTLRLLHQARDTAGHLDKSRASAKSWAAICSQEILAAQQSVEDFAQGHTARLQSIKDQVGSLGVEEDRRWSQQEESLSNLVKLQERSFQDMQAHLSQAVASMLSDAFKDQQAKLSVEVTKIASQVVDAKGRMADCKRTLETSLDETKAQVDTHVSSIRGWKSAVCERVEECEGHSLAALARAEAGLQGIGAAVESHRDSVLQRAALHCDGADRAHEKSCAAAGQLVMDMESSLGALQSTQAQRASSSAEALVAVRKAEHARGERIARNLCEELDSIQGFCAARQAAMGELLATPFELRQDTPTGATPAKVDRPLPAELPRPRPDAHVLHELRAECPAAAELSAEVLFQIELRRERRPPPPAAHEAEGASGEAQEQAQEPEPEAEAEAVVERADDAPLAARAVNQAAGGDAGAAAGKAAGRVSRVGRTARGDKENRAWAGAD